LQLGCGASAHRTRSERRPSQRSAWCRGYANVGFLAGSPSERVLAIFGAGHLGWLRQDVANDPTLRLRKLAELVR
jgi:hypothetical protein